jgi:hypothetical protein
MMLAGLGALLLASAAAHAQQKPAQVACADDPMFRQQDFTLGHWDVYAGEQKTAEVRMEKTLKDCAIHETWTTVENRPGNGLGLFTYSRLLKSWGYFWVADTATTTAFAGSLQSPGNMRYVTEAPLPDGGKRLRHWSLILQADGTVRELAVGTNDGKTWTTDYDLLWRKKPGS